MARNGSLEDMEKDLEEMFHSSPIAAARESGVHNLTEVGTAASPTAVAACTTAVSLPTATSVGGFSLAFSAFAGELKALENPKYNLHERYPEG